MTIDIEQLRKDMEAGTHKKTALTYNDVEWCAYRIDELEREYLALREAADALAEATGRLLDGESYIAHTQHALAAYRKATG